MVSRGDADEKKGERNKKENRSKSSKRRGGRNSKNGPHSDDPTDGGCDSSICSPLVLILLLVLFLLCAGAAYLMRNKIVNMCLRGRTVPDKKQEKLNPDGVEDPRLPPPVLAAPPTHVEIVRKMPWLRT